MTIEERNQFIVGWADGENDARTESGRPIAGEDPDYSAGSVGGKYKQVLYQRVKTRLEALDIWSAK